MKIEIPTKCPCCDFPLEQVNDQLFCRNNACSAQLYKKVEHFCKTLGIKGMGEKTIEKLNLNDIPELYYLDVDTATEALGSEKTAIKLLAEIDKSKQAPLELVLASFSIPLFGNTAATKLTKVVSHIDEITFEKCKEAGLGDKVATNLITFLETDFQDLKEFLPFSFKSTNKPEAHSNGKTVCLTGKLTSYKTKSEATTALEQAGYTVVETVNAKLNYLVDEGNKGSAKRVKAESLGIEIITNLQIFLET